MMVCEATTPRVWAGCLAAYNAGELHGCWIDANQEPEEIMAEIRAMLDQSPEAGAEEFGFFDYEGFGPLNLCQYTPVATIANLASKIEEHGELFAHVVNHFCGDFDEATAAMDEYQGCYKSLSDWGYEYAESCGHIDDKNPLTNHIDWSSYARDFELGGDIWTVETSYDEVHVFWMR
jgi:antirestriction protein